MCVHVCICGQIFYFNLLNINYKIHKHIERNKNVSMTDIKDLKSHKWRIQQNILSRCSLKL